MKSVLKILVIFIIIHLTTYGWRKSHPHTTLSPDKKSTIDRLKKTVIDLSQKIGSRNYINYQNLNDAADYIEERFKEIGYKVEVLTYQTEGKGFKNIIAEHPGFKNFPETILVGAHYDTCFNPGADDNASGIAGLLEIAYKVKEMPLKVNVRFIAFTNEEPPLFTTEMMGSRVYTRTQLKDKERLKAVIILEMIGYYTQANFSQRYLPLIGPFYPHKGNFIAIVGNFRSKYLVKNFHQAFKKSTPFPVESLIAPGFIPGIYFSDHWSFWQEDIPAVMVTDTAYMRSPHYHKQSDLPETIDYDSMAEVVEGLTKALLHL